MVFSWLKRLVRPKPSVDPAALAQLIFVLYARGDYKSRLAAYLAMETLFLDPPVYMTVRLFTLELLLKARYAGAARAFKRDMDNGFSWSMSESSEDHDELELRELKLQEILPPVLWKQLRDFLARQERAAADSKRSRRSEP